MGWTDREAWAAIEAAQAIVDRRREERDRARLEPQPEPAPDALERPETPVEPVAATPTPSSPRPLYAPADPRNPNHPKVDVVTGIRLYAKWLAGLINPEDDTNG